MDELKIGWDGSNCKFIHKKCHKKSYCGGIKYHVTLNTICSVASLSLSTLFMVVSVTYFLELPNDLISYYILQCIQTKQNKTQKGGMDSIQHLRKKKLS